MKHLKTLSENPDDYLIFDTETRALGGLEDPRWGNIRETSVLRYAKSSKVTLLTYCIGEGDVDVWALEDFDGTLRWRDAPEPILKHLERAREGKAWFVAWNSAFDRHVCNHGMVGLNRQPVLTVEMVLDAMAQATASNLPGMLDRAAQALGQPGKIDEGQRLINLFSRADGATPQEKPEDWQLFIDYALRDTAEARDVFFATRHLTRMEWEQFWVSEKINDRGLPIDKEFVERAAEVAEVYEADVNRRVVEYTREHCYSVNQHVALAKWVADELAHLPEATEILVKRYVEDEEEGLVPAKLSLARDRIERLIPYLERLDEEKGLTDAEFDVLQLLETKLFGGSSTPKKFAKMLPALTEDNRLPGQFVFNGAQQTGRFSSRGVQVQNLSRQTIKDEEGAIAFLLEGEDLPPAERLSAFEDEFGDAGRALSRLIRPAITAPAGRTLVWGDWSAIEARVLPWLANTRASERVLDIFRASDADPSAPDIYKIEAANIAGKPAGEVTGDERQTGKVAVLSLGYGGGMGALKAMATGYGMALTDAEAITIVDVWRQNNRWARAFWDALWTAFQSAMANPSTPYQVGRVVYMFDEGYLGGTMLCFLPDGRPLAYPSVKWRDMEFEDEFGEVEKQKVLSYRRGGETRKLWHGTLAENITQATAASLLRRALAKLDLWEHEIVGHVHDEIIVECDDKEPTLSITKDQLQDAMEDLPGWATGLPLAVEVTDNWYYSMTMG